MYKKNKTEYQKLLDTSNNSSNEEVDENPTVQVTSSKSSKSKYGCKVSKFDSYDGLTIHPNMKIRGGATAKNKGKKFSTLEEAVDEMNEDDDAMSIMRNNKGQFTLHSTQKMINSGDGGSA